MALSGEAESELQWAERVSRRLLEPLGARWRHTFGVARRARAAGRVMGEDEAEILVAAAYVHDIGYAPELADTGFHAVDGARFVRSAGHERLAGLVAHHSGAGTEARERGLDDELSEFVDERSVVSRSLTYCDLTTDSEGGKVDPMDRLAEIRARYDSEGPEVRALEHSAPVLLDDVRTVKSILAKTGEQATASADRGGGA